MNGMYVCLHCVDALTVKEELRFFDESETVYLKTQRNIAEDFNFSGILACLCYAERPFYCTRSSLTMFTKASLDTVQVAVSINNSCMNHLNIIPTHGIPVTVRCITVKQCEHFRLYPK
jgi:hypothetical protein